MRTANEWVSIASEVSTFIEAYPLIQSLIKFECTAPTAKIIGTTALSFEIFLSERIRWFAPSLTAISASTLIFSILSFKLSLTLKVQSIILTFEENIDLNYYNCELVNIGLSKTYIFSFVRFSKSKILPKFPNRVFKLITLFSLKESIGGFVT